MTESIVQQSEGAGDRELASIVGEFRQQLDQLPAPMFICSLSGMCAAVNKAYLQVTGSTLEDSLGWGWLEIVHPDDKELVLARTMQTIKSQGEFNSEHRVVGAQQQTVHVKCSAIPLYGKSGMIGWVGSLHDLTNENRLIQDLESKEVFFNAVTHAMREGLVVQDATGAIVLCNLAAEEILGLTQDQMMGKTSMDKSWRAIREDGSDFPGDEHPAMIALQTGKEVHEVTMGVCLPNGTRRWLCINSVPILDPELGTASSVVTTFFDATRRFEFQALIDEQMVKLNETQIELELRQEELVILNAMLKVQAETDALTKIFNRGAILSRLEAIVEENSDMDYGVILFDIDKFKSINDTLGHHSGDEVLKAVATIVEAAKPSNATVGRYGGEEFLIVCTNCNAQQLASDAEKFRTALEDYGLAPCRFTASFGTAHSTDTKDAEELVKLADFALYQSKENGRNQVTQYKVA